jgi:hypothetical protein
MLKLDAVMHVHIFYNLDNKRCTVIRFQNVQLQRWRWSRLERFLEEKLF